MKKNNFGFVIFLILAMLVVPIFTFVSCDNGTTPQVPENPNTPPVDTDGEDDKEDDKTQDEEKDEVINHLVGEWIMDELFITCKINEDKSFETIVEIDEDTTNYEGTYVLGENGKSATATVNNVPTENGETITATVTMEMLEGQSDVFSMDLTAFDLGDACTFVKKQSTTPDFVGTWSNEWWDILIDETNYAVIGREPVGEYAGVTTSKGEITIFANTITLTQTEFPEMLIATGVMSTNGKSYVNYYHQTSSAPGTWKSDVFTRTSTEIPEMPEENPAPDNVEYIGKTYTDITPTTIESKIAEIIASGETEATLFLKDFTNDDVVSPSDLTNVILDCREQLNVFLVFTADDNPNLDTIGTGAFGNCSNLVGIELSENIKTIKQYAFLSTGIKSLILPKGLETIEQLAISSPLDNLYISNTVTTIGASAIKLSDNVTSVYIPASVSSMDGVIFSGASALKEIVVSPRNNNYKSVDNVIYTKDGKTIVLYPEGKEGDSYTVPEGVVEIGASAFSSNKYLKTLCLPSTLEKIESSAFASMVGIESMTIPNSVTSIGAYAFAWMDNLSEITLPEYLEELGKYTFSGDELLVKVEIPNGVKVLDYNFNGCTGLKCVILGEDVEYITRFTFSDCDELVWAEFKNTERFFVSMNKDDVKKYTNGQYVYVTDDFEANAELLSQNIVNTNDVYLTFSSFYWYRGPEE